MQFFHKAHNWHLTKMYEIQDIAEAMQMNLFLQCKRSSHCLNYLYVTKNYVFASAWKQLRSANYQIRLVFGVSLTVHILNFVDFVIKSAVSLYIGLFLICMSLCNVCVCVMCSKYT
jgi:hypothetical protein